MSETDQVFTVTGTVIIKNDGEYDCHFTYKPAQPEEYPKQFEDDPEQPEEEPEEEPEDHEDEPEDELEDPEEYPYAQHNLADRPSRANRRYTHQEIRRRLRRDGQFQVYRGNQNSKVHAMRNLVLKIMAGLNKDDAAENQDEPNVQDAPKVQAKSTARQDRPPRQHMQNTRNRR